MVGGTFRLAVGGYHRGDCCFRPGGPCGTLAVYRRSFRHGHNLAVSFDNAWPGVIVVIPGKSWAPTHRPWQKLPSRRLLTVQCAKSCQALCAIRLQETVEQTGAKTQGLGHWGWVWGPAGATDAQMPSTICRPPRLPQMLRLLHSQTLWQSAIAPSPPVNVRLAACVHSVLSASSPH
ncbi:hypothetical protein NDU88_003768 [Pleurodeles waltl]|uniref:Uncharacterized protein n=1 Tax=Pleurodeles waltl TaxID=8319 RepID=A0AAV7KVW9_PLEWA|nr:hypothetical protein NDU88_003768 [Pleurodeles waltl]